MPLTITLRLATAAALTAAFTTQAATLPPAGATVYWSETGPQTAPFVPGPSFIKSGLDLGGALPVVTSVVSGTSRIKGPNGLEVLDGRLWWPDQQLGRVGTTLPNGSALSSVSASNPYDLDIDAGLMVWSELNTGTIHAVADPLGAQTSTPLLSGLNSPSAVDLAGGYLYWSEVAGTDRLQRSNADGSNAVTLLTNIQSYDFEVTPQYIYLTTTFGDLVRSNLDGSGRVTLASGIGFLNGIDVDGSVIYLSDLFGHLYATDLNGQNLTTLYTAPAGSQIRGVGVLSAVPEPGSGALLLAGAGVVAGLLRRQRLR